MSDLDCFRKAECMQNLPLFRIERQMLAALSKIKNKNEKEGYVMSQSI